MAAVLSAGGRRQLDVEVDEDRTGDVAGLVDAAHRGTAQRPADVEQHHGLVGSQQPGQVVDRDQ
jgi:hypothetical protein